MIPVEGVHTFRSPLEGECRFVTTWSPRGFEGFFLEFGVAVEEADAFERSVSEEMIQRVVTGCSKYGMIIVEGAQG